MAKTRQAALIWSQEDQQYLWHNEHSTETIDVRAEPEAWQRQLADYASFSFQGREGHLSLLKEARARGGGGYWYAYRRQGKRTAKKYAGRTADLSAARLEQMARALRCSPEQGNQDTANEDARGAGDGRGWRATDLAGQQHNSLSSARETPLLVPKFQLPPLHPLLVPKFQLPPLHPLLVPRERGLSLLDRALEHRLTLVSAPAGYGKTTLVRQWVAERSTQPHVPPVAWVSLDGGDNDPVRFWRYLMTACQVYGDHVAPEALALLESMPQPPFEASLTEPALTVFLNALAHCEGGGILVLDDYQAITSPRIHQTMTFFLAHLPGGHHVIILTRSDPPFSLPISGDLKQPSCATRDIAAVGARLLLDHSWSGVASRPVLGPEDLSYHDMARIMSEVLGTPVRFQQITGEAYKARLLSRGMSEAMAQGNLDMWVAYNQGIDTAEPRTPESTTPTSFRQWCEEVLSPAVLA